MEKLMNDSGLRKLVIICFVFVLISFMCEIAMLTGLADTEIRGFAVDSSGKLYVGMNDVIRVYDKDIQVSSISPQSSRAYAFTILEDDSLLLSTANKVYKMTTDGDILDSWEDKASLTYNNLRRSKKEFISGKDTYTLKGNFFRNRIVKNNNETVYQITLISFIFKMLAFVGFGGMTVCIFMIVRRVNSHNV